MKKAILINSLILTALLNASPAFAQSADVSKVQSFITNIIQIMVTLAGLRDLSPKVVLNYLTAQDRSLERAFFRVSRYLSERGEVVTAWSKLQKIADALGVDISEITK